MLHRRIPRDPTTPTPGECRPWLRAVGPGGLVPAGGRVGQLTVRLDSVYFDTEQHDLLAYGVDTAVPHRPDRRRMAAQDRQRVFDLKV